MIDRKMSIREFLEKYPDSSIIFDEFGLGCAGCEAALFENIEQAAQVHGVDVENLMEGLAKIVGKK